MPRDVLTSEYAGTGSTRSMGAVGAMRRVEIPGIGIVEFPGSMSDADVAAAARTLHSKTNTKTASTEQFTPAPRMTRLDGDPSIAGFGENLVRGAVDTVTSIPRVLKGLTKINPAELPGQIVGGIRDRVQSYADDPLGTIYDDPLSFLGDAATATGIGAAARVPLQAGARGAAATALKAGPAARTVADVGMGAARGALESKVTGGSAIRGAMRGGAERIASRASRADAPPTRASAAPDAIESLAEGYDRYMPNRSTATAPAPRQTPTGSTLPSGPKARAFSEGEERGIRELDELLTRVHGEDYDAAKLFPGKAGTYRETATPLDPQKRLINELLKAETPAPRSPLTKAGRSMLTPDEQDRLLRALSDNPGMEPKTPRGLLPEITQTTRRQMQREGASDLDLDAIEDAIRAGTPLPENVGPGTWRRQFLKDRERIDLDAIEARRRR